MIGTEKHKIKDMPLFPRVHSLVLCLFLCCQLVATAQDVQTSEQMINSFRDFSGKDSFPDASSLITRLIEDHVNGDYLKKPYYDYNLYEKTFVNIIERNDTATSQQKQHLGKKKSALFSKYIIQPFDFILDYARSGNVDGQKNITVLLFENYESFYADNLKKKKGQTLEASQSNGLFKNIGFQNISSFLDEVFGSTDLFKENNDIMLLSFKGPLHKSNMGTYTYRLTGKVQIDGVPCYEVFFFCKNMKQNAFAGRLYISEGDKPALMEADFTFNNPQTVNYLNDILFKHYYSRVDSTLVPVKNENVLFVGNRDKRTMAVSRTYVFSDYSFDKPARSLKWGDNIEKRYFKRDSAYWANIRPIPLTEAQSEVYNLEDASNNSKKFTRLERTVTLIMSNAYNLGGVNGKFQLSPLTHFISYNQMEGLRLRVGGNTMINFSDQFQLGGYMAYGTKDQKMKYQANLAYSLVPKQESLWEYPKKIIAFTYASDLNIPGQNVLDMVRDNVFQSFMRTPTNNMSLQRVGLLTFESENSHNLSYKIGGKITYDRPMGVVRYLKPVNGTDTMVVNNITSTDLILSLRFAPGERFIQVKQNRVAIRRAVVEVGVTYRKGIKGLFGAGYNYDVLNLNLFKRVSLPENSGIIDTDLSAGKMWGRVPFPLLFVPEGNQSYVFSPTAYNNMNFYEFATDRFVSATVNSMLNWSPARLFDKNNKMKICLGGKVLYGALSDNNNPAYHSDLFVFNNGITALGDRPYAEVNIGLANIFNLLRIDYVRRLTYTSSNSLEGSPISNGRIMLSGSIAF